jgi:hypothetical protein
MYCHESNKNQKARGKIEEPRKLQNKYKIYKTKWVFW